MSNVPDPKKLIINYLPQAMTDLEFSELFMTCGKTSSTKIMRDRGTGYSFGYGFVEYTTAEEAQMAIEKLNGWTIGGKSLKVAYSKPPSGDKSKNVNLYLSGLGKTTTEEQLEELFGQYGTVVNAKIVRDKATSQSKGTGFVLFTDKEDADKAMQSLQGHSDGYGMQLQIKYAKDSMEQQRNHPAFQAYLQKQYSQQGGGYYGQPQYPQQNQWAGPQQGYQQYPPHGHDNRMNNMGSGYGGGYASAAGRGNGRGGARGGQRFNPLSRPQGGQPGPGGQAHIVFVYNIGKDAQEKDMYALFAQYGRITKVDVMQGKGFAFVHMPVYGEAQTAVNQTNGMYFPQSGKTLQVSFKS